MIMNKRGAIKLKRKYFTNVDKELLRKNIKKAVTLSEMEDIEVVIVEEYVDSHHGIYIPSIFYQMIGHEAETKEGEDGWYDEFNLVLSDVSDELNEILEEMKIAEEHGHKYGFYVDYTENGDLGFLLCRREEQGVKKLPILSYNRLITKNEDVLYEWSQKVFSQM